MSTIQVITRVSEAYAQYANLQPSVFLSRSSFGDLIMRHLLRAALLVTALQFSGVASAADLPLKAPPAPAPVYYNWTGFYLGVNLGGSWGHQSADACGVTPAGVSL